MRTTTRRRPTPGHHGAASLLAALLFCLTATICQPPAMAGEEIMHPMQNPAMYTKGNCPNCGMMLNMWARTRHVFKLSDGQHETCSIRCLADMATKAGEEPKNVQVALYLQPEKLVDATKASYVVGSNAKGTMTMVSKLACDSKASAQQFAAAHGGQVTDFSQTLAKATAELEKSRPNIDANRKKMGKIKEPGDTAQCTTCGMYPARYPMHRSQALTATGDTLHFCSTRCLVSFRQQPSTAVTAYWVTVYPEGGYDYAAGLYYVVGSKTMGPMGAEALPFRKKADAEAFAAKEGGKVVRFDELNPELVGGGHMMQHHM